MKDEKSRIVKIMSMWACTGPLLFACLILILSGVVKMGVSDFAIDSQGRIYMKAVNEIEIYENQEKVGSINVNPLRGYHFTVLEDVVWVSDGGRAYTLDLNSCEDPAILADIMLWECEESTPELEKRVFVQDGTRFEINGDTYERHNALFWSSIKKNGEVTVYQISAFSFIVKQFLCFYFIVFLPPFSVYIARRLKEVEGRNESRFKWGERSQRGDRFRERRSFQDRQRF